MAGLGFLGLGAMGTPMASRLIQAGHQVTVWNRTRSRAETFQGRAAIADTPADAARGVQAVITMLATPDALSEVLFGDHSVSAGIQPGTTLIDMSTVGPDHVLEVAARLPEGVELIDAPVLGGVANATDGTLQIFVGASQASFARCRELLAPLGTPIHLGPTGAGAAMKLVANATLAGLMSLVGEALALADGFGLDQQRVIAALLDSPIGPALSRKLDKIQGDHYVPSFRLSLMRKDLGLVLQAAERRGVDLTLVKDAAGWIEQAEQQGLAAWIIRPSSPRSGAEPPEAEPRAVAAPATRLLVHAPGARCRVGA